MSLPVWKTVRRTEKHRNPWWTYFLDVYQLPSGKVGEYHFVHTNGSSMVIPITGKGSILLVRQYRYLLGRESLEFPCGSVKDGRTHEETAHDELAEETGYAAGRLSPLGEFNPYNGVTDEMCRVYLGSDLRHVGENPDETEVFELSELSPVEIERMIADGTIWDGMSLAAWTMARGKINLREFTHLSNPVEG